MTRCAFRKWPQPGKVSEALQATIAKGDLRIIVKAFGRPGTDRGCCPPTAVKVERGMEGGRRAYHRLRCDGEGRKSYGATLAGSEKASKPIQQLQEEWVALVYIHYSRMVLLQVRSRLMTTAALYLFLVWAATSYPYLNRHALLIALAALLGLLSFAVILIYASINRDPILSRTTNHVPGRLDLDFYLKTVSWSASR